MLERDAAALIKFFILRMEEFNMFDVKGVALSDER